jgi:hypothetical protein
MYCKQIEAPDDDKPILLAGTNKKRPERRIFSTWLAEAQDV